jgi:hypothetical protein
MASIDEYSDEELGQMVRRAAKGREQEMREAARTKSGLQRFFEQTGLLTLALLLRDGAVWVFHQLKDLISSIFG